MTAAARSSASGKFESTLTQPIAPPVQGVAPFARERDHEIGDERVRRIT
jgi:hypothetical protein